MQDSMQIGVLSDTHGLLRPTVLRRLRGVEHILHAGDVEDPAILDQLRAVAPVTAVRGNTDGGPTAHLPWQAQGDFAGVTWRMVHRREDVPTEWLRETRLIVHGHSHRPELSWHGNSCLVLNPGACGKRRFQLPLTIARLTIVEGRIVPELVSVEE